MHHRNTDSPPLEESNFEAFELTQAELNKVTGGTPEGPFYPPYGYIKIGGHNGVPPPTPD
jgi:hypothetical protein